MIESILEYGIILKILDIGTILFVIYIIIYIIYKIIMYKHDERFRN
jgi:Na+-transporting methylmalonyl-CoA/oxaloacetate decarboxylase gamma subunit